MKKMKYLLVFRFEAEGAVDDAQVIGTIFKHLDGLFWPDADLDELNKREQVGWIEVEARKENNKTQGIIRLPLTAKPEVVALVAAEVEAITNISAFPARVTLERIEDVFGDLKKRVYERAKELLRQLEGQIAERTAAAIGELRNELNDKKISK